MIPISEVKIIDSMGGADFRTFERNSKITLVSVNESDIVIDHTMRGRWPTHFFEDAYQEATFWLIAKINGEWWAGPGDRVRPSQTTKALDWKIWGSEWYTDGSGAKHLPLANFKPEIGEHVGLLVTTPARFSIDEPRYRTNVVEYVLGEGIVWTEPEGNSDPNPVPDPEPEPDEPENDELLQVMRDTSLEVTKLRADVVAIREILDRVAKRFGF